MRKHSIKTRLIIIMVVMVVLLVGVIWLLDTTVFESFAVNQKLTLLEDSYNELSETLNESFMDGMEQSELLSEQYGMNISYLDSNWGIIFNTGTSSDEELMKWFQKIVFQEDEHSIVKDNGQYVIAKMKDEKSGFTYLMAYGIQPDSDQIFMMITLENIRENISVFNRFLLIAGGVALLIGIVFAVILSSSFVKPVQRLSRVAEAMSEMNFDIKYEGSGKDEIGLLGNSMNTMSTKLESKISELARANLQLTRDIQQKEKAEEKRREFVAAVSHELKTPIALISGYAEGLCDFAGEDEESRNMYCEVIIDEAGKMNNIVKKMLEIDELESGNTKTEIERINLREIIEKVKEPYALILKQSGILLESIGEDAFIFADKNQITEVVDNFFTNAIHYCEGAKRIRTEIIRQNGKCGVSIFNTGKQIPEEAISKIWEKFYKVDKARTRLYGGSGIGLSIVRAILDGYNAEYGVKNADDGVEFYFLFEEER